MSDSRSVSTINPFEVALEQLDEAAKLINLDKGLHQILAHPKRVLTVSIPVRLDNNEIRVFTGFRSQHNARARCLYWRKGDGMDHGHLLCT